MKSKSSSYTYWGQYTIKIGFYQPYQSQILGTIFDLINVFSLLTEIVHNMPSIFVIGKGISEVKKL